MELDQDSLLGPDQCLFACSLHLNRTVLSEQTWQDSNPTVGCEYDLKPCLHITGYLTKQNFFFYNSTYPHKNTNLGHQKRIFEKPPVKVKILEKSAYVFGCGQKCVFKCNHLRQNLNKTALTSHAQPVFTSETAGHLRTVGFTDHLGTFTGLSLRPNLATVLRLGHGWTSFCRLFPTVKDTRTGF